MKVLIVVDMQKDFVDGALANPLAQKIIPAIKARIVRAIKQGDIIIFTKDTHDENYLNTQEGKKLPVPHAVKGTLGHDLADEFLPYEKDAIIIEKPTFGSFALADRLMQLDEEETITDIEMCGVVTDICVISNAVIAKTALPNAEITINEDLCAGLSEDKQKSALDVMTSLQISVISKGSTNQK